MRLAQQASINDLPGVTRTVTIDLADLNSPYTSLHNRQKQQVAKRVALNALATAYDRRSINTGPVATSVTLGAQQTLLVRVQSALPAVGTFKGSVGCISCCNQSAFEIGTSAFDNARTAPAPTTWTRVPVGATYQSSDAGINIPMHIGIAKVIAVRYAYDSDVQCVYFDSDGLPLAPFALHVFPFGTSSP